MATVRHKGSKRENLGQVGRVITLGNEAGQRKKRRRGTSGETNNAAEESRKSERGNVYNHSG